MLGWDTESTAKVAIAQLREKNLIQTNKCPKAQLIRNESIRWMPNVLKILGYFLGLNIIVGIVVIVAAKDESKGDLPKLGPDHTARWRGRGVAMIFGGPLLFIIDLIKFICNRSIVNRYQKAHPQLIEAFNTSHGHTLAYWPRHPVFCEPK